MAEPMLILRVMCPQCQLICVAEDNVPHQAPFVFVAGQGVRLLEPWTCPRCSAEHADNAVLPGAFLPLEDESALVTWRLDRRRQFLDQKIVRAGLSALPEDQREINDLERRLGLPISRW
jgi:hypothetical protein